MSGSDDSSWSRALMASSGIALDHGEASQQRSAEWHEAGSAALTRERLMQLASHREAEVREVIALRGDCPMGVLATLAYDRRPQVRRAVAASARVATAIAAHLSTDRDPSVLRALARNPVVADEVLQGLARHRREEVSATADRMLAARAEERANRASGRDLRAGATGPSLPSELRDRYESTPTVGGREELRSAPRVLAPRPSVVTRGAQPRRDPRDGDPRERFLPVQA
ncbi:hypothetical protein [Demequina sp. NBRC 110052]|uniref:hypothetical protein n=1 Tax=Demequina sp. NBRC 110052 TaxID=1570341 RepID=UPI0009FC4E59|nr:hypothetical protein [Demequina sp. NBRC 110052]